MAPQKKYPGQWRSGFSVTVGTSTVNRGIFSSFNRTYSPATSVTGPGQAPGNPSESPVSPDFSFGLGDFLYKELSRRVMVSAGINYRYYSTTILTGRAVDSSLSFANANRYGLPSGVNSYFRTGTTNRYVNQYHFIEVPVLADIGLSPRRKVQLVWEVGASLGVFLTSNALHFDPTTRVYYKDIRQFNELQANASTSILICVKILKTRVQVGPQFQYGWSDLLHRNSENPGHLLYGGIKISFLPKKD